MLKKLGKYEIIEEIGKGAMGHVYKAFDPLMGRYVALKTMSYSSQSDAEFKKRFFKEAQAPGRLHHENIVVIYELNEDQGVPFIAMEFLEGDDLFRLIQHRHIFTLQKIIDLIIQVCEGLHFAHSHGIIHRDIKPANIFLLTNGKVKIVDFGIAHISQSSLMTKTGMLLGTPSYMSPEQVKCETLAGSSDQFSLGVIMYELLTGRRPFDGETYTNIMYKILHENPRPLRDVYPACPSSLEKIVLKALDKSPENRFADLASLARRLRKLKDEFEQDMSMEPTIAVPRTRSEEQSIKIDLVNRYLKEGKFDQALRVLDKLRAQGESPEIIEALQEDIAEKKRKARIEELLTEGITFFDDDHYDLALECFNEALSVEPENTMALEWVRKTHQKEAEKRLNQTIEKYMQLGHTALQQEKLDEAKKLYSEALKLNPAARDLSVKLNDIQELIDRRERQAKAEQWTDQARVMLAEGQRDEARRYCRLAMDVMADYPPAAEMLDEIAAAEKEEVVGRALQEMEALYLRKEYDAALQVAGAAVEQVGVDSRLKKSTRQILAARRRKWLVPLLIFVTLVLAVVVVVVVRQTRSEPVPVPNGVLLLDIRPAVQILDLIDTGTREAILLPEQETPLRLALPTGRYRLRYQRQNLQDNPIVEEFAIDAGQTVAIRKTLPEFDVETVIESILSQEDSR
ncbi:MAG: protein kinase [Acidobacteria bacterium]|nr:protein kinase [Acidobacteriota bacterium]